MKLLAFLGSGSGRLTRGALGAALVAVGLALGGSWIALAIPGVVALAAGVFDFCLLGPLFKLPIAGKAFRRECPLR